MKSHLRNRITVHWLEELSSSGALACQFLCLPVRVFVIERHADMPRRLEEYYFERMHTDAVVGAVARGVRLQTTQNVT